MYSGFIGKLLHCTFNLNDGVKIPYYGTSSKITNYVQKRIYALSMVMELLIDKSGTRAHVKVSIGFQANVITY